MKYKAIVLDLDGTLMNTKNEISKTTQHYLLEIQKQGITLILASGRPTHGLKEAASKLELDKFNGYILSYNGGKIINAKTGQTIYETALNIETIFDLYDKSRELNVHIMAYHDSYIITEDDDEYIQIESRINNLPIVRVPSFKDAIKDKSVKCLMTGEPNYLAMVETKLKEIYQNQLSISRSMPFFLECMPKGIDKANCLEILLNQLGIQKQEVIACGDGYNDISMIERVGLGVAMANGCKEIKDKASYITYSNDEDGIVHVIKKFIYNEQEKKEA